MAVIEELIRKEDDGSISFGNYLMDEKKKVLDFEVQGDLYNAAGSSTRRNCSELCTG